MSSNQVRALLEKAPVKVVVALAIVIPLVLFFFRAKAAMPLSSDAQLWKADIQQMGPDKAYEKFAKSVEGKAQGVQHGSTHAFGAALYEVEGDEGFPICRDLFQYGCAHGFIARALQIEGIGAVSRFAEVCRTQSYPGMCLHGIGHGLVSSMGYDEASYQKAVAACRNIAHDTSTAGCVGGSTMEYGLKTMATDGTTLEPVTDASRFEPCISTNEDAKSACYYWITGWWYTYLTSNLRVLPYNAILRMGEYCRGMDESQYVGECFGGIGDNVVVASDYNGEKAIALCNAASPDVSEQLYCKAYAANILLGDAQSAKEATILCDSTGSLRSRCQYLALHGVAVFDAK